MKISQHTLTHCLLAVVTVLGLSASFAIGGIIILLSPSNAIEIVGSLVALGGCFLVFTGVRWLYQHISQHGLMILQPTLDAPIRDQVITPVQPVIDAHDGATRPVRHK